MTNNIEKDEVLENDVVKVDEKNDFLEDTDSLNVEENEVTAEKSVNNEAGNEVEIEESNVEYLNLLHRIKAKVEEENSILENDIAEINSTELKKEQVQDIVEKQDFEVAEGTLTEANATEILSESNSLQEEVQESQELVEFEDVTDEVELKEDYEEVLEHTQEEVVEKEIVTEVQEEVTVDELEETIIIDREELARALGKIDEENKAALMAPALAAAALATEKSALANSQETAVVEEKIMPVLEVLDLKKRIKFTTIVEDITFDMYPGEIIGLLGPNGSGKTTIMRMLVGLTKISSGEVYCFEKPLGLGNTNMLTEVGSMIESPEFYNYMSGYANLKLLARLSGKKITRSKIKELIKFVGLEKVARKKVKTYSLGMRQRLGLAQALLHDPKILILDEPVNGLDPQGVQEFRNKLREIAATGVSILISSHLLDEIEKVSDRIIVLEKGRIIADDTLENLCSEDVERTIINTHDNERAVTLVDELEIPFELTDEGLLFEGLARDDKNQILSYLVNSYVEIETIKIAKKTLEERFLEITGKGGLK